MAIIKLLPSPVISMFLLPCFITLFFLIKPFLRILHNQETMSLTWPFNFDSLDRHLSVFDLGLSMLDTDAGISKHRQTLGEQVNCVFCLSDINEGEEIRKLRCSHLFHRLCLDKWLKYQRASCPLCRSSLATSLEFKEKLDDREDEEPEDSGPPLLAFVLSEWWGRCVLLAERRLGGGLPL